MARRGRLIAVEGGSASGKSALVRAASHTLGWRPLPEAFDRLDPAPSLDFGSSAELLRLEATLLAEEVHRYAEARRLCGHGVTVLADTGFLGPLTYTLGLVEHRLAPRSIADDLARSARALVNAGQLGIPDLTVYLRTTAAERAHRARAGARSHPSELFRRHEAVGKVERRLFERDFMAAVPDRVRILRADASPSVLVRRLGGMVERAGSNRASRPDALAVIARLRGSGRRGRRSTVGPNR
jgi:hypothetical protein